MTEDMLQKTVYLRERADVTYEEAAQMLTNNNGDVIACLVELEKQGRVYEGGHAKMQHNCCTQETREKVTSFFKEACKTRIVIEKRNENGDRETVVNLSAPVAAGITIVAPYLTLAAGVIALATGHQFKVKKENA
jgi:transcriptional regulator of heat shock response